MENNINAYCAICSKGYHVCSSCLEQRTFRPWRTVTDTMEHYKIYLALHGYTISKDKEQAVSELEGCDLSGMEDFNPEVKAAIHEIMDTDTQHESFSVQTNERTDGSINPAASSILSREIIKDIPYKRNRKNKNSVSEEDCKTKEE